MEIISFNERNSAFRWKAYIFTTENKQCCWHAFVCCISPSLTFFVCVSFACLCVSYLYIWLQLLDLQASLSWANQSLCKSSALTEGLTRALLFRIFFTRSGQVIADCPFFLFWRFKKKKKTFISETSLCHCQESLEWSSGTKGPRRDYWNPGHVSAAMATKWNVTLPLAAKPTLWVLAHMHAQLESWVPKKNLSSTATSI